jgi:AraC-like DNA-binding protein
LKVRKRRTAFQACFPGDAQQLLTKLRIASAMRLLNGEDGIASIGQQCGFADQSTFARQFKAAVGMSLRDDRNIKGPV